MANPQVENGHVDIANEIIEAIVKTYFSSSESRIFWAIVRKTWGWHKKTDRISYTQFETMTGMSRRHIAPALKRLISRQIITQTGNGYTLEYGVQKDYEQWKIITQTGNASLKSLPEQVTKKIITQTGNASLKSLPEQVTKKPVTESLPVWDESLPEQVTKSLLKQVNTKEKNTTIQKKKSSSSRYTFSEYVEEIRTKFPSLDIDNELEKFNLYWSEGNRKLQRPKLAFRNWLERALNWERRDEKKRQEAASGKGQRNPHATPKPGEYTRPEDYDRARRAS